MEVFVGITSVGEECGQREEGLQDSVHVASIAEIDETSREWLGWFSIIGSKTKVCWVCFVHKGSLLIISDFEWIRGFWCRFWNE